MDSKCGAGLKMRLVPSDPDVETILTRIENRDIDLQPEFQRGEVWSRAKKQRLIDSILRDWHVPPIHIIEVSSTRKQEVLDGQQRLAAIRDFAHGKFSVDGKIEPSHNEIRALDGCLYQELPDKWKRHFNQFTIRVFRIVDYDASEPGELFFRLNQPTSLTSAEQRNAFFGPVREQIKALVTFLEEEGLGKDQIGFSNARMAYDDVLARAAWTIERRTLSEKVTSTDLVNLYRSDLPLSTRTIKLLHEALVVFARATEQLILWPRFNKATLYSWLLFLVRARLRDYFPPSPEQFAKFLTYFESTRDALSSSHSSSLIVFREDNPYLLYAFYDDRSTSRVADVSSVILRDAIIWMVYAEFHAANKIEIERLTWLQKIRDPFVQSSNRFMPDNIAKGLIDSGWGQLE
jgi:hypothetical protein